MQVSNAGQIASGWLRGLRIYLAVILTGNLVWEVLHLPLYTIWQTGSLREQAFAVLHCTLGDLLIATTSLVLALLLAGDAAWPVRRAWPVAALTILFGVSYTIYSEWLNVSVRAAWAYSEWMPVIAIGKLHIGLSPLLQWIVLPAAAAWIAHRRG
ncbi:MAG: hypothetical protein K8F62_09750 [Pseudorhodoplanes sp.]|nr:hypothetical protein [Pseudorhodoplanes sp.]